MPAISMLVYGIPLTEIATIDSEWKKVQMMVKADGTFLPAYNGDGTPLLVSKHLTTVELNGNRFTVNDLKGYLWELNLNLFGSDIGNFFSPTDNIVGVPIKSFRQVTVDLVNKYANLFLQDTEKHDYELGKLFRVCGEKNKLADFFIVSGERNYYEF